MKKITYLLILPVLACLAALSGCSNDLDVPVDKKQPYGLPAKINFMITVPANHEVRIGRDGEPDPENVIKDLVLVFYNKDSEHHHYLDLSDCLALSSQGEQYVYKLSEEMSDGIDFYSGNYTVYGLANLRSKFVGAFGNDELMQTTQDQLEAAIAQMVEDYITDAQQGPEYWGAAAEMSENYKALPMTSRMEGVNIKPAAVGGNNIVLALRRVLAHIRINIKNDDESPYKPRFVPGTFRIYNLPRKCNLISKKFHYELTNGGNDWTAVSDPGNDRLENPSASDYFNLVGNFPPLADPASPTNVYSLDFFMLENPQETPDHAGVNMTFNLREAWRVPDGGVANPETFQPEDKEFLYAPKFGTYVVFEGAYSSSAGVDGDPFGYEGTVRYTLHLGNLNAKDSEGNFTFDDFSVNRNEYHTYNVRVVSAKEILAECAVDGGDPTHDITPGVEGTLTRMKKPRFVMDSHFETIMLKLTQEDVLDIARRAHFPDVYGHNYITVKSPVTTVNKLGLNRHPDAAPYPSSLTAFVNQDWIIRQPTDAEAAAGRYPKTYRLGNNTINRFRVFEGSTDVSEDEGDAFSEDPGSGNPLQYLSDYKWIIFQRPREVDGKPVFPIFAGAHIDTYGNIIGINRQGRSNTDGIVNNPGHFNGYITDLIADIADATKQWADNYEALVANIPNADFKMLYYKQNEDLFYVTAFIDEFVYQHTSANYNWGLPLYTWVNTVDDRQMSFNVRDHSTSYDKLASVANDYTFIVAQRSMKSTYDLSNTERSGYLYDNVFGIETWHEALYTNPPYTTSKVLATSVPTGSYNDNDLSVYYGRDNTIRMHADPSNQLDEGYSQYLGYNQAPGDFDLETGAIKAGSHQWDHTVDYIYNAVQACIARNLDLNSNGVIDDDEIMWYLPALGQFYTIWMGQRALPDETRLFFTLEGEIANENQHVQTGYEEITRRPKYYTSSSTRSVLYWPELGGHYTPADGFFTWTSRQTAPDLTSSVGTDAQGGHRARACRNFPTYNKVADFPFNHNTIDGQNVITAVGVQANRRTNKTGMYGWHHERQNANLIPQGFVVSKSEYAISKIDLEALGDLAYAPTNKADLESRLNSAIASALSSVVAAEGHSGQWRIPNQRELMLILMFNHDNMQSKNDYMEDIRTPSTAYLSSTWFSGQKSGGSFPYPFVANNGNIMLPYKSGVAGAAVNQLTAGPDWSTITTLKVVFVRDATDTEVQGAANAITTTYRDPNEVPFDFTNQ